MAPSIKPTHAAMVFAGGTMPPQVAFTSPRMQTAAPNSTPIPRTSIPQTTIPQTSVPTTAGSTRMRAANNAGVYINSATSIAGLVRGEVDIHTATGAVATGLSLTQAAQQGAFTQGAKATADRAVNAAGQIIGQRAATTIVSKAGPIGTVLIAGTRIMQGEDVGRVGVSVAGATGGAVVTAGLVTAGTTAAVAATGTSIAAGSTAATALVGAALVAAGITAPLWVSAAIAGTLVTAVVAGGAMLISNGAEKIYDAVTKKPEVVAEAPKEQPKIAETKPDPKYDTHPSTVKLASVPTTPETPASKTTPAKTPVGQPQIAAKQTLRTASPSTVS